MDERCSLKQIAKGVIISTMDFEWNDYLMMNDDRALKPLDTIVTTLYHFTSVFDKKFEKCEEQYNSEDISAEQFIKFLTPRCEILSKKCDHFGFFLTCSFVSEMLRNFSMGFHCFHYHLPAYKYLSAFLETKFKSVENKSNWNQLLQYCRELNRKIYEYQNRIHHMPLWKPPTSDSNDEAVEAKITDESNERKWLKNDRRDDFFIKSIECSDNDEYFSDDSDDEISDDEMFAMNAAKEIPSVSQNTEIEQNKTLESDGSDIEILDLRRRKRHKTYNTVADFIDKLACSEADKEEINADEYFNNNTDECVNESLVMNQSEEIPNISKNDQMEHYETLEISETDNEITGSSPISENDTMLDTTISSEDSENWIWKRPYFYLLMPDPKYRSEIIELIKMCRTEFEPECQNKTNNEEINIQMEKYITSNSATHCEDSTINDESNTSINQHGNDSMCDGKKEDKKTCLECKGKRLRDNYRKWKRTFEMRYKNLHLVSDFFKRQRGNDSSSS